MKKQKGFTLIELIMVIVILGILSAFALPRFVNFSGEAREAVVEQTAGAIVAGANIVRSKAIIEGKNNAATESVDIEGNPVNLVFGYPAATEADFEAFLDISGDYLYTADVGNLLIEFNGQTDCNILYEEATSVNDRFSVTRTTTGC